MLIETRLVGKRALAQITLNLTRRARGVFLRDMFSQRGGREECLRTGFAGKFVFAVRVVEINVLSDL